MSYEQSDHDFREIERSHELPPDELYEERTPAGWCEYCSCVGRGTDDCSFPEACLAEPVDA